MTSILDLPHRDPPHVPETPSDTRRRTLASYVSAAARRHNVEVHEALLGSSVRAWRARAELVASFARDGWGDAETERYLGMRPGACAAARHWAVADAEAKAAREAVEEDALTAAERDELVYEFSELTRKRDALAARLSKKGRLTPRDWGRLQEYTAQLRELEPRVTVDDLERVADLIYPAPKVRITGDGELRLVPRIERGPRPQLASVKPKEPKPIAKAPVTKPRGGFSSMTPEARREASARGGRKVHERGTAHRFTREEARKGGLATHGKLHDSENQDRT